MVARVPSAEMGSSATGALGHWLDRSLRLQAVDTNASQGRSEGFIFCLRRPAGTIPYQRLRGSGDLPDVESGHRRSDPDGLGHLALGNSGRGNQVCIGKRYCYSHFGRHYSDSDHILFSDASSLRGSGDRAGSVATKDLRASGSAARWPGTGRRSTSAGLSIFSRLAALPGGLSSRRVRRQRAFHTPRCKCDRPDVSIAYHRHYGAASIPENCWLWPRSDISKGKRAAVVPGILGAGDVSLVCDDDSRAPRFTVVESALTDLTGPANQARPFGNSARLDTLAAPPRP
jgi:hypothetical protein